MKHLVFLILAVLLLFSADAMAQTAGSPQNRSAFYTYYVAVDSPATASEIDTLISAGAKLGGYSLVTFQVTSDDSAAFDVYVDWAYAGYTTWTNAITDSMITVVATGYTQEYILRDQATDNIAGLDKILRARVSARATGQGTGATYDANFNFKP